MGGRNSRVPNPKQTETLRPLNGVHESRCVWISQRDARNSSQWCAVIYSWFPNSGTSTTLWPAALMRLLNENDSPQGSFSRSGRNKRQLFHLSVSRWLGRWLGTAVPTAGSCGREARPPRGQPAPRRGGLEPRPRRSPPGQLSAATSRGKVARESQLFRGMFGRRADALPISENCAVQSIVRDRSSGHITWSDHRSFGGHSEPATAVLDLTGKSLRHCLFLG